MNTVDWVIVGLTVLMAIRGYMRGFIVSALTLVGFVAGALLGSAVGPLLLSQGHHSPYAPLFSLGGALLLGGLIGGAFEGLANRIRGLLFVPGLHLLDGLLGAVLTALVALGIAWIVGAIALQSNDFPQLRHDIEASSIIRDLDQALPPSGPILGVLSRIDPLPSVTGPAANVPAPSTSSIRSAGAVRAQQSVVRVVGQACGLGIEGSGWVAGPDEIVTNAHVVAGEVDTSVQIRGIGAHLPATVVLFDPTNDIAVLRVPGLNLPVLTLAEKPVSGESAAIFGYPENGPFTAEPGRLGETEFTETQNAYGNGPVLRQIAALRGLVRPGNSGGPMIDAEGQVIATVFAEITNAPAGQPGGFAVPDAVVRGELSRAVKRTASVSTQSCAD
jgi:S1-C subfamily serine protease